MKQIIKIFINDIKAITRRLVAAVILGGLVIIPGIYAWLNIDSNWDPYENTKNLPIAIVNKDKGATILGDEINVGESLVDNLKNNDAMGWKPYHKERENEVRKELEKSSTLYGEIIIPDDFSKNLTTVFQSKDLKKPNLLFIVNNKKNPIAPLIVKKAVSAIETTLNKEFVNTLVLKALNTADEINLVTKIAHTTDELIDKLDKAKDDLDTLKAVFNTLQLASDSTSSSLSAFRDLLPTITSLTGTTEEGVSNLQNALKSFKGLTDNVSNIVNELEKEGKEIKDIIKSIDLDPQKENVEMISAKMDDVSVKLAEKATKIKNMKEALQVFFGGIETPILTDLQNRIQRIIDDLDGAKKIIDNNKKTKSEIKNAQKQLKEIYMDDISVNKQYRVDMKSDLDNAYGNASKTMDGVKDLMSGLNKAMTKTDKALEKMIHALDNSKELNDNIDTVIVKIQEELDKAITTLQGEKEKELYNNIVNILENDPNKVADFISNPVQTNTKNLYDIKSYGSKMAPFYTILACWVGCTILIAIIKTDLEKTPENDKLKNYQKFLGRFILFAILAMSQGFFISVGDIILKVQVINKPLFILTTMTASLVFMLFIYSLAISFGKVGEAVTIIIMVLQVAGSGGTFPIELLPRIFQVMQPIMPFYPAMNALRETIGGFYENDYLKYMLMLLAHTIIPLILGLVLRNPLIHLKEKVEKEVEKTKTNIII